MKKFLLFASAFAGLFLAASCQQETLETYGEGIVTFSVTAPGELDTRAIADGVNVDEVHYAVYKTDSGVANSLDNPDETPLAQGYVPMSNKKATLELDLLQDQNYTILFWAQVAGKGHYVLGDLREVKVASATVNANDESRAAFFRRYDFNTTTKQNYEVELYRPFAQINLGTTLASLNPVQQGQQQGYSIDVKESEMVVKGIASSFSLVTGEGKDEEVDFKFSSQPTPAKSSETLVVNNIEYHYVAMNYLLIPVLDKNVTVSYKITTDKGVVENTINNVPVKENYRTNIIGNLLTSKTEFEIIVDEKFEKPDLEADYVWGGEIQAVTPVQDENGVNVYNISTAAELAWIAQQVNSETNDFEGEIVRLVADIDLNNQPWTPIGLSTQVCFKGMFEGAALTKSETTYPTIKNLYIHDGNCSGLFKILCNGGKIRNINFDGARLSGERQLGVVAGQIYGNLDTPVVEKVTVENAEITAVPVFGMVKINNEEVEGYDNGDKIGGIAGLVGQNAYVAYCTVKNITLKAYRDMGGIVGSTQNNYASKLIGNNVENITFIVTAHYTPYADDATSGHYDAIRGGRRSNEGDDIESNTSVNEPKVYVESSEGSAYDSVNKEYVVTSPAGLAAALQGSGAAGAGNHTIQINGDLDMTGMDWTPIVVDGYNGADIVTVEGNDKTIKGLDGALFAGGFAGGSGIVIKNLTIEDAHMIADNTQGYGAFVNCADSMDEITLINCHLKNSTIITPNDGAAESRIGGLVGWTAGYNNQNDGPVDSYITIQNCSVTGCTLKGAGSIGGICGHAGANAATFTTIENCTVTGNTLVSTDDGGWRVGAIVGTANNGQCKINNVTVSGNTISQVGKTAEVWQSEIYGRFVPAGTGTLTIDGVAISATKPTLVDGYTALYNIDGNYYVYNKKGLEELNNFFKANAFANHVWTRSYNIGADIDATGFAWDCVYLVVGSNDLNGLVLNGNGYTISNLTINGGGLFTGTPKGANEGTESGYVKNITIDSATVTGDHTASVFWANAHGEIVYENVVVKNTSVTGNCNVGVFIGATTIDYPTSKIDPILFKNCAVENCIVVANGKDGQDPTGASGFVGRAFANTSLKFEGTNTIDEATTITNNNGLVGGRVYAYTTWVDGGFEGTGVCDTFTNWDGVSIAAKVGTTTYPTIEAAIEAAKAGQTVKLVDDVTVSDLTLPAGIIFNGNGKQINGTIVAGGDLTFAGHTKVTSFSASYYNRTITIGEGACLEVTGTDRVSLAYGNTFDIIGDVTDAKIADKTDIQPSLIIPGGISITGGNNAVMSIKDAYVQIGSTTSKNNSANGTFTLNIKNSIVDFTDQFTLSEPKNGMNPTFKVNVENSVLTTVKKFCIAAKNSTIEVDNSSITTSSNVRNSGTINLKNGSLLSGNTIQFGENGGNDGIINVDASTLTINAGNAPSAFDGKGVGVINATNSATVSVTYYKDMTIKTDATSTFTGTEVQ